MTQSNSKWPIAELTLIQRTSEIKKRRTRETTRKKSDELMLFIFKGEFLKSSVDLHTALAAETNRIEGQWLEEQQNMVKFHAFRIGTRMQTASRRKGQYLAPLKTFNKNIAQEWRLLFCSGSIFKFYNKLSFIVFPIGRVTSNL
jgi:hypothetical protein